MVSEFARRVKLMHKLRLKFSKNGPIKFIGHLDVMRYFQKAIRRAGVDIKYSEGFSPHQVLSFAQPLSVGATSDGEYLDMTVNSMNSPQEVMDSLNAVMNEGIEIVAIAELDEREEKAMTTSYAAKYHLKFRENSKPDFDWVTAMKSYLAKDNLPAIKKTKSGEKEIDMKPMIINYEFGEDCLDILLMMSSKVTLKPTLLFEYFFRSLGREFNTVWLDIHRVDIYRDFQDGEKIYIEPFIPGSTDERIYLND